MLYLPMNSCVVYLVATLKYGSYFLHKITLQFRMFCLLRKNMKLNMYVSKTMNLLYNDDDDDDVVLCFIALSICRYIAKFRRTYCLRLQC